jgi:general secretion pathway protein B
MSYILDALRKADAERQRGAVPGLHDQTGAAGMAVAFETHKGRGLRLPLIVGLLAVTALVGALWLNRGLWPGAASPTAPERERQATLAEPPTAAQTVQSPAPGAAVTATQAPAPLSTMPGPRPAPAALPAPVQAPAPAPSPVLAPATSALAAAAPAPSPTPQPPAPAAPAAPAAPRAAPPGNSAATPPPASPAPQPLPRLADLPEAQRRELPPLVVGGAVQSLDPASRMLIVDGQVLREGDAPAPGLLLERIGPRAAVFSRGGLRFEIPL